MSLTARSGPFGWLPAPFGLGDSDRHDVVYGVLDHKGLDLEALFQEADD